MSHTRTATEIWDKAQTAMIAALQPLTDDDLLRMTDQYIRSNNILAPLMVFSVVWELQRREAAE